MKKMFLFLMMAFIIIACDDKPTEPQKLEEIDWSQISFTPNTINLKPGYAYNIEFTGINFTNLIIDSIKIDNKRLETIETNESKIICKIKNANPGIYQIELYQEGKVFILDKKINFIAMEYSEPTKENIYFLPDTIFIDENNKAINFTLYGTDFEKYKITEVYLNSKKCYINKVYKDSIHIVYPYLVIGVNYIYFVYKGEYKTLDKPLIISPKNGILNLNCQNYVSFECKNIPIWERSTSTSYSGPNYTETERFTDINFSIPLTSLTGLNGAEFSLPYNFNIHSGSMNTDLKFKLGIDTYKRRIEYFEFIYEEWVNSFTESKRSSKKYKFENIPYKLIEFNSNPQIVAEIFGKDVDKSYPLIYYSNYSRYGNNSKTESAAAFVFRNDSTTGKLVNYYPATDSSYIKITIGN